MQKRFRVFLSSTFSDLIEERQHALGALHRAGVMVEAMEYFAAASETPWEHIQRAIDDCDYYVLILAARYGSVDPAGRGYTEREFDYALQTGKPVLCFLHCAPHSLAQNRCDIESELREKLNQFRKRVRDGRLIRTWENGDQLSFWIYQSLVEEIAKGNAVGWVRSTCAAPSCQFLRDFAARHEPALMLENGSQDIDGERAYRILRFMFETQRFGEFRAFDLAFYRWQELVNKDEIQTLNISERIFANVELLLEDERCGNFRRLLMVTPEQCRQPLTHEVFRAIEEAERKWRTQFSPVVAETRASIFDRRDPKMRRRVQRLHDFALFSGTAELAIVETGLSSPYDVKQIESSTFEVTADADRLSFMKEEFEELWDGAKALSELLKGSHVEQV